jgi:integrase
MKNTFTLIKRNSIWYYYAYDKTGERRRFSTGQKTKMAAQAYCTELLKKDRLIPEIKKTDITFLEFSQPFWIWEKCPIVTDKILRGFSYSQTLCKSNRGSMAKNIIPTFGKIKLRDITPSMINTWLLGLQKPRIIKGKEKPGLSNATSNKMLRILKEMLDEAIRQGLIDANPCEMIRRLHEKAHRRDAFSIEEAAKILGDKSAWGNDLAWLASYLSASTGMRQGEIRALTKADFEPDTIHVAHSFDLTVGVKGTKSENARDIPITKDIYDQVMLFCPISGFIFSLTGGVSPVSPDFILNALYARIHSIGISEEERKKRNLTFHSWRHFFNTRLIASGVQGEITRAIIGHEDEKMTEHYLHLKTGDMEAVVAVQNEIRRVVG